MKWEVEYTDSARLDLKGIYGHIADVLLEPSIAQKLSDRIMDTADSLDNMPFRHRLCDYEPWRSRGWRFVPVNYYLIFYLPDESQNTVFIMRIIYGERDMEAHLSE